MIENTGGYSKLSIKKVNNIKRQINLYNHKIVEILDAENSSKYLVYNSGEKSITLRDFYEYYIDGQPLINIISKYYWNIQASENSEFFNSYVSCLGSFGLFWDEISVSILTKKEFNSTQIKTLVSLLKSNYINSTGQVSIQNLQGQIIKDVRDNFLMYCCQDCGDSDCGGITLNINKKNDTTIWTDNDNIEIHFNTVEYEQVLQNFITMRRLDPN